MGQYEVIELLKKYDKPVSRKEIAIALEYDVIRVSHIIKKLLKNGEIKCIEVDRIKAGKLLGLNRPFRRTRFYYV